MTNLVPREDIERIVGAERHPSLHIARSVSAEEAVYILHSRACLDSGVDLRCCDYSHALDNGIRVDEWEHDVALVVHLAEAPGEGPRLYPWMKESEVYR